MMFNTTSSVPVTQEAEDDIKNDGFFPDLILADARDLIRIDGTITSQRLRAALVEAMISVNEELNDWAASQILNGNTTLEAVPAKLIDDVSINTHRYKRAVYCFAKSNLIERYRDFDSSNEGNKRADDQELNIADLRRDHRWAVNDILGKPRSTIELI